METYTLGIAGLTAAYAGLAVVVLSIHIYSNWNPWVKAAVTGLGIALCVVTYNSYPKLLGWPVAADTLPSRLYLVAIEIIEPHRVYLWARDLDQGLKTKQPRAYELPYTKSLHKQAEGARSKLRRGIAVIAEIEPAGSVANLTDATTTKIKSSTIRFIDAPQGLAAPKQ